MLRNVVPSREKPSFSATTQSEASSVVLGATGTLAGAVPLLRRLTDDLVEVDVLDVDDARSSSDSRESARLLDGDSVESRSR